MFRGKSRLEEPQTADALIVAILAVETVASLMWIAYIQARKERK